jgi:hypothetical protein
LVEAEAAADAEWEKQVKFVRVAAILKDVHDGKEWDPKFLAKTSKGLSKKGV